MPAGSVIMVDAEDDEEDFSSDENLEGSDSSEELSMLLDSQAGPSNAGEGSSRSAYTVISADAIQKHQVDCCRWYNMLGGDAAPRRNKPQ